MFYTLMLAVILSGGTVDTFKNTKLVCSEHKYVYTRDEDPVVYLTNKSKDYASKFNTAEELEKEIRTQCQR